MVVPRGALTNVEGDRLDLFVYSFLSGGEGISARPPPAWGIESNSLRDFSRARRLSGRRGIKQRFLHGSAMNIEPLKLCIAPASVNEMRLACASALCTTATVARVRVPTSAASRAFPRCERNPMRGSHARCGSGARAISAHRCFRGIRIPPSQVRWVAPGIGSGRIPGNTRT
jgi:hypothetical protein